MFWLHTDELANMLANHASGHTSPRRGAVKPPRSTTLAKTGML